MQLMTTLEIARAIKRTPNNVSHFAKHHGIKVQGVSQNEGFRGQPSFLYDFDEFKKKFDSRRRNARWDADVVKETREQIIRCARDRGMTVNDFLLFVAKSVNQNAL